MNVLFLSLLSINSLHDGNIYSDLLLEFTKAGHSVFVLSPIERRERKKTHLIQGENYKILRNKILNIQKTNLIEKGISTLTIEGKSLRAIKKYFKGEKFDLVLYATPPITFAGVVSYFKKRGAKTYLLLKDIFPQNCVDIGLFSKSSIFYKFFRRKEKKLYALSDYIGTMSQANADYILEHNKDLKSLVEVCPNSEQEQDLSLPQEKKLELRNKYGLPTDKKIVIYGGNLGRPQNIPYFVECLNSYNKQDFYFVIVGGGTDANKISDFALKNKDKCKYISQLPKQEYLQVLSCADVGLILLDSRFTIPNFPSRMLSYLKAKLPIMCLTDSNSDMGKLAEQNGFGYFAISDKVENFENLLDKFKNAEQNLIMGQKGYDFFVENYTAEKAYKIIEKHFKDI